MQFVMAMLSEPYPDQAPPESWTALLVKTESMIDKDDVSPCAAQSHICALSASRLISTSHSEINGHSASTPSPERRLQ